MRQKENIKLGKEKRKEEQVKRKIFTLCVPVCLCSCSTHSALIIAVPRHGCCQMNLLMFSTSLGLRQRNLTLCL